MVVGSAGGAKSVGTLPTSSMLVSMMMTSAGDYRSRAVRCCLLLFFVLCRLNRVSHVAVECPSERNR